ncbi:alkaline phosphatase D [Klebsormidium nitens]|uniref:Alkaline phosphatase D n=1 Tax=Klebsormidium nitens TaxID=105231 RepID=A0A1Y1HZF2_KLENI|nr:alkaline phosphatase D [Klebsormidium nitens]|eukprot:GAQ81907.1 alkaline phosphatase D [Klebsormidium nitens]
MARLLLLAAITLLAASPLAAEYAENMNYQSPLTTRPDLARSPPDYEAFSSGRKLLQAGPAIAFNHGVASGDPGIDNSVSPFQASVILWTRVTPASAPSGPITVNYKVATDAGMTNVVMTGSTLTTGDVDYTVKVTVKGLTLGGVFYYYQFSDASGGVSSLVGRLKTLQQGDVSNVRFAVVSCSNFPAGYFNAYRSIADQNVDLVLHLGDYIYEYKDGGYATTFADTVDATRKPAPDVEIVQLVDYRIRHAQYKTDEGSLAAHAAHTWVTVWDDHEFTNNAWFGGAENHQPATEGDWFVRKANALRAYFEWMPIAQVDPNDPFRIFRSFNFGNLVDLTMLDTRIYGRQQQVDDPFFYGVNSTAIQEQVRTSPGRTIMGDTQEQYLYAQLTSSQAKWRVIGQQVIFGQFTSAGRAGVLPPFVSYDAWDGYADNRDRILAQLQSGKISNTIFLSGDLHSSVANDLPRFAYPNSYCATVDPTPCAYNATTGAGSLAVEFLTTAVTSPSALESLFGPGPAAAAGAALLTPIFAADNPAQRYLEWNSKGYLLLDITPARAQGSYCYVSTITSKTFTTDCSNVVTTQSGANHLVRTGGNIPAPPQAPAPAPVGTTSAPTGTTSAPPGTTAAPGSTTSAPAATTSAPVSTTSAPTGPVPTFAGAGPTCDATSSRPNQCFNADGTFSICCPGSCPDSPGAEPVCKA